MEASAEVRFWRAIEIAVGGTLAKDILDVGSYVASRGDTAVAEFEVELHKAVATLREAGVSDVLQREASTSDGRAFADLPEGEVDYGLQALILAGKRWYELLLDNPERQSGPSSLPLVDLQRVVEDARTQPGIDAAPLWQERPGDRRRDGSLWINLFQALGVGVPDLDSPPWTIPGLIGRFRKAALVRSLDDSWREWRSGIGARALDVWLEYCLPGYDVEGVVVTKRGRMTSVTVHREFPRLLSPGDPVQVAEREADAVFDAIRDTLS